MRLENRYWTGLRPRRTWLLPEALLEQAKSLDIDVSKAAKTGLAGEVTRRPAE
jgi:post-segregation antitoxin (ccd killing protein)